MTEDIVNRGINVTIIAKEFVKYLDEIDNKNLEIEGIISRLADKFERKLKNMGSIGDVVWNNIEDYDIASIENDLRDEIKKYSLNWFLCLQIKIDSLYYIYK